MQFLFSLPHLFAATSCSTSNWLLGFPTWYQYLTVSYDATTKACQITSFTFPGDLVLVALAIVDILLRIAGLVALGYVVYGGIKYVTSQGSPDGVKQAQDTLINALIGMVIALVAAGVISFIGNSLK